MSVAEVAGGHNFRPDSHSRLKYRYYHKHRGFVEEYEESKLNYKRELETILDKNKEALEQIEKEYRNKYEDLQKNHIRLINDMKRDGEKFDVALEQCEQEYEKELLKRRDDFGN